MGSKQNRGKKTNLAFTYFAALGWKHEIQKLIKLKGGTMMGTTCLDCLMCFCNKLAPTNLHT